MHVYLSHLFFSFILHKNKTSMHTGKIANLFTNEDSCLVQGWGSVKVFFFFRIFHLKVFIYFKILPSQGARSPWLSSEAFVPGENSQHFPCEAGGTLILSASGNAWKPACLSEHYVCLCTYTRSPRGNSSWWWVHGNVYQCHCGWSRNHVLQDQSISTKKAQRKLCLDAMS